VERERRRDREEAGHRTRAPFREPERAQLRRVMAGSRYASMAMPSEDAPIYDVALSHAWEAPKVGGIPHNQPQSSAGIRTRHRTRSVLKSPLTPASRPVAFYRAGNLRTIPLRDPSAIHPG